MKRAKKSYNDKEQMKKRKEINAFGEAVHNCPYLLAVVISSLIMMIFAEDIDINAIASETGSGAPQVIEMDVAIEESPTDSAAEPAESKEENLEILDKNGLEQLENEGKCREDNDDIENNGKREIDNKTEINRENTEKDNKGVTSFITYEPQEIDSYYYSDAGKIALTTEYPYTKESARYLNDAVFIGDSRTLGISDYAGFDEADFYCDNGMSVFKLLDAGGVTYQKTGKKEDLNHVLQQKHYGKIYIMLGMNDLGYGNTDMYLERYRKTVNQIREWQPKAIIYVMANLHVSKEKNNPDTEFNNININDKNAASASLANGTDIFYLDANPLFTDSDGFLNAELSFDGVHLYAQHYDTWREFLLEHAVETMDTDAADHNTGEPAPDQITGDIES